jgi:hypothetical protein
MLKSLIRQGLLALSLAVPWLAAHAQTVPTPTTPSEQDRAKFGHLVEPLLLDPRLTTGRLLDAAMPLTTPTTTKVFSFDCQCITLHLQKK